MPASDSSGSSTSDPGGRRSLRTRVGNRLRGKLGVGAFHHEFAAEAPSAQQTVDVFAGQWITAFPDDLGVQAGWVNHFDPAVDNRVPWADSVIPGGLAGKSVLELGPFEGYHTASLEWAGAASVVSVEASRTAYLKCLVVKELLGLKARLLYGDVPAYLQSNHDHVDVVWASGILYHQADPITFLEAIGSRGDHVFLHTHYFQADKVATMAAGSRFRPNLDQTVTWHGRDIRLHHYAYEVDTAQGTFAGGPRSYACWLEREDIEFILTELGFSQISYGVLDPDNPAGPGFFLLASRP